MTTKPCYKTDSHATSSTPDTSSRSIVTSENILGRFTNHLVSAASLSFVTLNLVIASIPLALVVLARAILRDIRTQRVTGSLIDQIYRGAVHVNTWWITRVLDVHLTVNGGDRISSIPRCIILSNHQTWFDILVIQAVVARTGPIVHFLIKEELAYVPVVGWICLMLGFPRLKRGTARESDLRSIETATVRLRDEPAALLNFAEGTRFTEAKRQAQNAEYKHLLKPKTGGMRIMMQTLPDVPVIDLTLAYPGDRPSFWHCLSGQVRRIDVHVDYARTSEIGDVGTWLNERWAGKDQLLEESPLKANQ